MDYRERRIRRYYVDGDSKPPEIRAVYPNDEDYGYAYERLSGARAALVKILEDRAREVRRQLIAVRRLRVDDFDPKPECVRSDRARVPKQDETPTVCTAPECGRTRPRWTMEQVGGSWVCSPEHAMHCGACCAPGEYLTHYTEEEHRHGLVCARCGRTRPVEALKPSKDGALVCRPDHLEEYDECMRRYNRV